jgi:DNA-binding XRE family transcriptional regulator
MPASTPMAALRQQAADLIIERLKNASVAKVAGDLKISRQAVYDINKRKYCPSLSLVQKACEVWQVPFTYGSIHIDASSFPKKMDLPPQTTQMTIFELLGHLDTRDFEVIQTKPMGRTLEITLRLTIPEEKTA